MHWCVPWSTMENREPNTTGNKSPCMEGGRDCLRTRLKIDARSTSRLFIIHQTAPPRVPKPSSQLLWENVWHTSEPPSPSLKCHLLCHCPAKAVCTATEGERIIYQAFAIPQITWKRIFSKGSYFCCVDTEWQLWVWKSLTFEGTACEESSGEYHATEPILQSSDFLQRRWSL